MLKNVHYQEGLFFSPGSWMEASVEYRTIPTREYKTNKKAQISIQAIQVLAKSGDIENRLKDRGFMGKNALFH